ISNPPPITIVPPADTKQPEVKQGDGGVDFKPSADSIKTEKTADGKTNVTVTLKSEDLNKAFEALGSNNSGAKTINVNVDQKGDSTKVNLPAGLLAEKSKTNKEVVIAISSDDASINIPLQAVNYDTVAAQLGVNVADVTLSVSMTAPTASEEEAIRNQAKTQKVNVVNVVNFTVTAEGNGKSQEITNFGSTYIPRTIVVSEQAAGKQYMAVIIDSVTGELQFIPASVDAKGHIVIMAPHASTYAIVEKSNVTFSDIRSHWAKSDIEVLASKLLIQGTSTDTFSPEDKVSRAEFTALIARALGLEMLKSDTSFTDVASNGWYAKAIHAAVEAGIIQGRTATSFAPNATITREEMSIMIARALAFAGSKVDVSAKQTSLLSAFADKAGISTSAQTAVAQAVETKIVRGDGKGNFNPKSNATRAEAAVTIKRLLEYLKFI
ncbi:MAG: S-layer homology domain-containing protein, partial [Cohnella sp.]|nr:S-layer homology domain-containing protein [Cohnella sp.]